MEEKNYIYEVFGLRKLPSFNGLNDVVTSIDLRITAQASGSVSKIEWTLTEIDLNPPTSGSFTPFEELTEAEVLSWVETTKPFTEVKKMIDKKLDDILYPKEYVQFLPWNTGSIEPQL